MATKDPGWREFTKLVAHHILRNIDRDMPATIMHTERVPYHLREDGGVTRPSLNNPALTIAVEQLYFS